MKIEKLAFVFALCVIAVPFSLSGAPPASHQYIVKLKYMFMQPNASAPAPIKSVVGTLGGRVDFDWGDRLVVTIPDTAAAAVRAHGQTRYLQRVVSGPFVPDAAPMSNVIVSAKRNLVPAPNSAPPWKSGKYTYDGAGNIVSIGSGTGDDAGSVSNDAFVYDGVSRLTQATVRNHQQTFSYDGFGNLTSMTTDGSSTMSQTVDHTTNRFTAEQYDAAGDDVGDGSSETFAYDPFNMMRQKDVSAANATTYYVYTPDDERIGMITCGLNSEVSCGGKQWMWSLRDESGKVLRQYEGNYTNLSAAWTWIEDYVYRDGLLLGSERMQEEGGRRHFHLDHLGTPRLVTGDQGQKVSEHDYYPFGVEIPPTFQDTASGYDREEPMRFTGHERDLNVGTMFGENSNYNDSMHARQTVPVWGRFLSVDPLGGNPYRPQTWNRYTYALNNPLKYIDPNGLSCKTVDENGRTWITDDCVTVLGSLSNYLPGRYPGQVGIDALRRQARRGNDFAALQLNFGREIHNPFYTRNIEATHTEFVVVAPLSGFLRKIGMAGGEIGLRAGADETGSFFDGATFNLKTYLKRDGTLDAFHNFPESVMAFEDEGTVTTIQSAGGTTSQMLQIPGSYMGKEGVFEFIKTHMNEITHYLFNPNP